MYKMDPRTKLADFSSLSVINVVDKFVKAVDLMNETVMVPSRLLNVELPSDNDKVPILLRGNSDPYTFFTVLNNIKNNLVWGLSETDDIHEKCIIPDNSAWLTSTSLSSTSSANGKQNSSSDTSSTSKRSSSGKGHFRSISSVSNSSVASSISSDPESERLSDTGDSGVDQLETIEPVVEVTSTLRTHLVGLQDCLRRLTETAKFITEKYQEEICA